MRERDVPTRVQASAFARSDTTLQLAWVIGGFVGIALPLEPARLGLGVAFAVLAAWTVFVLASRRSAARSVAIRAPSGRSARATPRPLVARARMVQDSALAPLPILQ